MSDKRCMMIVSSQQFNGSGGLGTGLQAQTELLTSMGYVIDIVMDGPPSKNHTSFYDMFNEQHKFIFPNDVLRYTDHRSLHVFSDALSWDRMVNFRESIREAMKSHIYDLCICQTPESQFVTYNMELYRAMTLVFYTHSHDAIHMRKGKADPLYNSAFRPINTAFMTLPNIYVGTHTESNVTRLKTLGVDNAVCLPLPMTERGLLERDSNVTQSGVLFIGRFEPRKQPKRFIELIKATGLPARIMTSPRSKIKFEKELQAIGCADYDVRADIHGEEKVKFIQSCKVFYMPSNEESYGLALYEAATCMPVVTHINDIWPENFPFKEHYRAEVSDCPALVSQLYHDDSRKDSLDEILELERAIPSYYDKLEMTRTISKSKATVQQHDNFYLDDYWNMIGRNVMGIEDWLSVCFHAHEFQVTHTKDKTWFSKSGQEPADDSVTSNSGFINNLFDFS